MKHQLLIVTALFLGMIQGHAAVNVSALRANGQAMITASVEIVDFGEVEVGYPETQSFTVTGNNLSDNINLTVTGRKSSFYQVTPQSITPQDAATGVRVTVKCIPSSQYISPASITLSSLNAEDVVIPITVETYYPAEMFLNNQTEQFSALVGQVDARKGTIRFADAEIPHDPNEPVVRSSGNGTASVVLGIGWVSNNYSLSIEGADSDQFAAWITKSSSISNICTVSVSYVPRTTGSHAATLKVNCTSAGVPLVTIPLRGESTGILCDLDNDGKLDVSDVTNMINLVLNKTEYSSNCDYDGDGKCDVSDVTKFISYLLELK